MTGSLPLSSSYDSKMINEGGTRTRIREEALRLFASKGYEKTTTKDLASAANIAEGTLFRYFPGQKSNIN